MKVNRNNAPYLLVLALAVTGCEFIGPQIHTKLPLPEINPADVDALPTNAQDLKLDENKKTTKVEIFSGQEAGMPSQPHIASSEGAGGKGEFSLNFDDADLGEVAKVILSDILGKNYTISPQVSGKVTLQTTKPLSKEELMPTLDMLLSINNAAIVEQNGMYLIKPSAEALYDSSFRVGSSKSMPSGYQVRVIPVKNVSVNEIADILKPLLPEKAILHVDTKRNIMLVAGSGSDLNRAIDLVNAFDIDVLKGRSFALFTPANVDASVIIEELEQIFNNSAAKSGGGKKENVGGAAPPAGGAASQAGSAAAAVSSDPNSFFRFIEIDRLNAILAITHRSQFLKDIETWVLRLDKTNSEGKGGVNVYRAQHVSSSHLANTLSGIFGIARQQSSASIAPGRNAISATNRSGAGGIGGSGGVGSAGGIGGAGSSGSMGGGFGGGGGGGFGSNTGGNYNQAGGMGLGGGGFAGGAGTMGGGGGQALMPNVKIVSDDSNNALIIVANAQEYAIIQKVLKQLDILPLQVMIDATIVEVTLNNDLQYGIEWFLQNDKGNSSATGGGGASLANLTAATATGGFSYLYHSMGSAGAMNAVLKASATKNNINVISSPSLMVLNNQEASIQVGDSVPILSSTSTSLVSTGVTSNAVQMIDTGVNLSIRPRVNSNGLVSMDLIQSVNQAVPTTTSGISSPTIQKRQIETSVAVQSGETIVLGGLIKENNTNNIFGVPWLSQIPYIGPLFGSTTRNKDKTELVVLLTPRVMKSRQDALDVTEEFKRKLTGIYEDRIQVDVQDGQELAK